MSLDINKYKKFVENGNSSGLIGQLADRYSEQEQASISHFDVLINSSRANVLYKNGMEYKCVVDYGKLPKKSGLSNLQHLFYSELMTRPSDGISAGDIVEFAHNQYEDLKTYLIIKTIETRDGYNLSIMQECNQELKWIDESGTIKTIPCVYMFNSRSNFGNRDDRILTLPDGRRQVVVQKNEHTTKIKRNARFIFGGNVFIVIDHDHVSEEGLVNINLKDDQFNPATDNLELGIADYYSRVSDEENDGNEIDPIPSEGYSIVIKSTSDKPDEIKRNLSKEYYVEIRNGEDLVSGETVTFELFGEDKVSNTNLAILSSQASTGCVVKNNNASSGIVWLKATLNLDESVEDWLKIQMKNLF